MKAKLIVERGFVRVDKTEAGVIQEDEFTGSYVWDADGSDMLDASELRAIADLLDKLEKDRKAQ